MLHQFKKTRRPFISLPRHKRADAFIKMKGDIKRETSQYGGMFISPSVMDESHQSSWCDFYFLGLDKFTIWNATIITAKCALQDAVHDLAYQQTVEMMTAEELEEECRVEFVPADRSKTGKILTYQMLEREQKRYDQFEGLTFFEQIDKLDAQILAECPPPVYESFKTDLSYSYGIGLHIVIDAKVINRTVIEQAIVRFRELGEQNWQAVNPVTFKDN